jgi:hypothetical protein
MNLIAIVKPKSEIAKELLVKAFNNELIEIECEDAYDYDDVIKQVEGYIYGKLRHNYLYYFTDFTIVNEIELCTFLCKN